ncbi:MAG: alanine racemase, partial [Acidimicrobiales bacterium]
SMALLASAHRYVGGELVTAGGTGTYDINTVANEIQAGSYLLMDTAYAKLDLPFVHALTVLATVISVNPAGWAVADCGLKALGMDHGDPSLAPAAPGEAAGAVWFCSDEHVTFSPGEGTSLPVVGDRVRLLPAHIDPTVAYHQQVYLADGDDIVEAWPVDLRGW